MDSHVRTFKDLVVWQKAFALCCDVYRASERFPANERYGMTVELRKTSRSVVYNIAEGHRRRSTLEYLRFLDIASGSAAELETQLLLAQSLSYFGVEGCPSLLTRLAEIDRMLAALMRSLRAKRSRPSAP